MSAASFRFSGPDRWFVAFLPAAALALGLHFGVIRPARHEAAAWRAELPLLGGEAQLAARLAAAEEAVSALSPPPGGAAASGGVREESKTRAARLSAVRAAFAGSGVETVRASAEPEAGGRKAWRLVMRASWDDMRAALEALAAEGAPDCAVDRVALLDAPRASSKLLWTARIAP